MRLKYYVKGAYEDYFDDLLIPKGLVKSSLEESDVLFLTGGVDINPNLYQQKPIEYCQRSDIERDKFEIKNYYYALENNKYIVGICRGAQLINVLNKGTLWQHANNHSGRHDVYDHDLKTTFKTNSIHHQICRRPVDDKEAHIIATCNLSTIRIDANEMQEGLSVEEPDIEVMWFNQQKSLCFQPHPEFGCENTSHYFWNVFERYISKCAA